MGDEDIEEWSTLQSNLMVLTCPNKLSIFLLMILALRQFFYNWNN